MNAINQIVFTHSKLLLRGVGGIIGFKSMYEYNVDMKEAKNDYVLKYPTLFPLYTTIGGTLMGLGIPKIMIGLVCLEIYIKTK